MSVAAATEVKPVFLPRREVERRVGLKRSAIYARMLARTFPRPVPDIDSATVWWLESDIEEWMQARIDNMGRRMGPTGARSASD